MMSTFLGRADGWPEIAGAGPSGAARVAPPDRVADSTSTAMVPATVRPACWRNLRRATITSTPFAVLGCPGSPTDLAPGQGDRGLRPYRGVRGRRRTPR